MLTISLLSVKEKCLAIPVQRIIICLTIKRMQRHLNQIKLFFLDVQNYQNTLWYKVQAIIWDNFHQPKHRITVADYTTNAAIRRRYLDWLYHGFHYIHCSNRHHNKSNWEWLNRVKEKQNSADVTNYIYILNNSEHNLSTRSQLDIESSKISKQTESHSGLKPHK